MKFDFGRLSPRAFIVIRAILVSLRNAHICFRLVKLTQSGTIQSKMLYTRLNNKLNEESSFQKFISRFVDGWAQGDDQDRSISNVHLAVRPEEMPHTNISSCIILKKRNHLKQSNDEQEAK